MSETQRNATVLRRETFALPSNPSPAGLRCLQIFIPDDDEYLLAMAGALQLLAKWNSWQRDSEKNGRLVAQTWEKALAINDFSGICITATGGIMEDFQVPIRVDCDCNVFIECPDGSEKQLLTADQVRELIAGSGPGTAPQPAPGGCQIYNGSITGLGRRLIPFPVSTGDTIEITNRKGATNGDNLSRWNCSDGKQFFAGACTNFPHTDAGALMPGIPIGSVIVEINGTWYDGRTMITVPGGVSNVQPTVALNYDTSFPVYGDVTFDVNVCNNAVGSFIHTFDFITSFPPDVVIDPTQGSWSAGVGIVTTYAVVAGQGYQILFITVTGSAARSITSIEAIFDYSAGSGSGADHRILFAGGYGPDNHTGIADGPNDITSLPGSSFSSFTVEITAGFNSGGSSDPGGFAALQKLIVSGDGSDPY